MWPLYSNKRFSRDRSGSGQDLYEGVLLLRAEPNGKCWIFAREEGNTDTMRTKGSETVLVVDDDPMVLGLIEAEIALYGFKPILAGSGEEALSVAESEKVDLLLTDIMMPGMNGIDLAKEFAVSHPEAKILFMSGYVCPSIAHQGIRESEYAFIQKPFAPNVLVKKMRNVLSGPNGLKELNEPGLS